MKKIFFLITIMLFAITAMLGQAPGILNYQGVARNSVGNVLANKTISLRLTIHDGSAAGPTVYQESRVVTTNPFGLFNVQLGSPGFLTQTGTIAGVPWGVGLKFIQVEIDPNGALSFINIGTAQLASVPYSLYANLAGDLVLPFNKTQADAGTLFKITNSGTGSGSTALEGLTNSTAANAFAIIGTVTSTGPGGFSTGVRGINNGTGGLGIGVWGSQNGSGWGVYGQTPSGLGVYGNTNTGTGVYGNAGAGGIGVYGISSTGTSGRFDNTNNANASQTLVTSTNGTGDAFSASTTGTGRAGSFTINNAANVSDALLAQTNGGATSWALRATSTGAQGAGIFTYNNAAGTANAVRITNNGSGAGIFTSTTGTGSAGRFDNTNAANPSSTLLVNSNSTTGVGLQVNQTGTGQVTGIYGNISTSTGASTAIGGADFSTGGVSPIENRTYAILGQTGTGGIAVGGYALSGGTALRGSGGGVTGFALRTSGNVQLQGINEAANRILTSDASGNATWQDPAGAGVVTGSGTVNFIPKWTPSGTNLGNSLLFDNGTNIGLGTITPTHRFTVSHGGSTGISISSTAGFSVLDINAASGDAAIRLGDNGVNQWNIRNRPGDDYLEIFELGGGGSRMVIQDGTGNVGIGQTANPTYKLDVLHGGADGLHVKSSSSFSVIDLDAANGDAALRYQNAGVTKWNVRNAPGSDDYQIIRNNSLPANVTISNATGFVGITQTTPAYQLDVQHSGATGIRSQSTSSFSVVDIDGASGDAALRFYNAGVSQWNIRNRPADDYLEIFELGGGGSRMVIQDGTGNVGIGATVSPTYRLDVEHGGSTGIRSRSTSSFSVVDIDGASGDAALRFANAGVNQWNTRNNPATNDYQIFELGGGGERLQIQDGTGNIGIGGVSPSYRLDVLSGGATGIRNQSSSSFVVLDIDAANGDAALRFARAGVNQWNIRNRPADDYLEIFELGGGGSRMVIQDGTGNVGIGNTTSPSYRLDVQHGGATGIRVQSTSTFSLVDNDAANGDAAFRFARAGVNQWNIRNNPANDDLQFFELGGGGERMRIENTTGRVFVDGDLHVNGTLSKSAGAFKIDHPLDPANKYLVHSFVESPDMMNIYNGNIVTDAAGKASITLPDYFEALNKDFRYQLTVIGSFAQAIISKEVAGNTFEIATSQPNVKVSWQVTGIRHDAWAEQNRIPNTVDKDAKDKGKYLTPEVFGKPKTMAIGYTESKGTSVDYVAPQVSKQASPSSTGGSIDYVAPEPKVAAKAVQGPSSTDDTPKTEAKAKRQVEGPGSTDDTPKTEVKPAAKVTGPGSTDEMPKPVENKKISKDPGSTKE